MFNDMLIRSYTFQIVYVIMIIIHKSDDVKTSFRLTYHLIYIDFIVKCNVSLFKWFLVVAVIVVVLIVFCSTGGM